MQRNDLVDLEALWDKEWEGGIVFRGAIPGSIAST